MEHFDLSEIFHSTPFEKCWTSRFLVEPLGISVVPSEVFIQNAWGWLWRAGCWPTISQATVTTRRACPAAALSPGGGHLLTMPDIDKWEQFPGYVSPNIPPLLYASVLGSTQGLCLAKLINLFNDAIFFFHINPCPENLPFCMLPRRRAFTGLLCEVELAPHVKRMFGVLPLGREMPERTVLWKSWVVRMISLIHKCCILVLTDCFGALKSFPKMRIWHFKLFLRKNGMYHSSHSSDLWSVKDLIHLLGQLPLMLLKSTGGWKAFVLLSEVSPENPIHPT